jgi:hypothetical protein
LLTIPDDGDGPDRAPIAFKVTGPQFHTTARARLSALKILLVTAVVKL